MVLFSPILGSDYTFTYPANTRPGAPHTVPNEGYLPQPEIIKNNSFKCLQLKRLVHFFSRNYHVSFLIDQITMRKLDMTDTRAKLAIYRNAGLLELGNGNAFFGTNLMLAATHT
jgi:hypothetical protein